MKDVTYYVPMHVHYAPEGAKEQLQRVYIEDYVPYRKARRLLRRWGRINHGVSIRSDALRRIVSFGRQMARAKTTN